MYVGAARFSYRVVVSLTLTDTIAVIIGRSKRDKTCRASVIVIPATTLPPSATPLGRMHW